MKGKITLMASALAFEGMLVPLAAQKAAPPNVVVILADDIGYTDIGCYGARKIRTPNLDRLAEHGVRFDHAYSPASTSSPSRYALLTGEYAWRKNVGILPADAPLTIDPSKPTMPSLMRANGYRTGIVGKWHLGLGTKENPVDFNGDIDDGPRTVGFDYAYYFPATNDRVPCVFVENRRVVGGSRKDPIEVSYRRKVGTDPTGREHPEMLSLRPHLGHDGTIVGGISRIGWMSGGQKARWDDATMGQRLLDKACEYVGKNAGKRPFFLYYAPHNAHEPRVPSPAFRGKSEAGIYGDVIEEFDYYVGQLVECLKKEGVYDNTLIVVTSDNGPMIKEGYDDGALENINGHDPFGHLRGQKYSLHEAGCRVPFIFSWPDRIKTPFVQTQNFTFLDMMATLVGLLGLNASPDGVNDSRDASALFLRPDAPLYREYLMLQNNGGQITIRKGDWKYIPAQGRMGEELYDLKADPSELHDLMLAYPDVARQLNEYVRRDYRR